MVSRAILCLMHQAEVPVLQTVTAARVCRVSNYASCIRLTRNKAIEQDAGDPDFLSNLSKLGQVRVDHHMKTVRPVRTLLPGVLAIIDWCTVGGCQHPTSF